MQRKVRKNKAQIFLSLLLAAVALWGGGFRGGEALSQTVASGREISIAGYLLNSQDEDVPNGEYTVRFSLYTVNREEPDTYPSNTDSAFRVWEETQTVTTYNGIFSTFLGVETPLPTSLTFTGGDYFLGVQVGEDAEMTPRKKLGIVPHAINSEFLRGAAVGSGAGSIVALDGSGKLSKDFLPEIDESLLPEITKLGTVSEGTWEADAIESKYITNNLTDKTINGLEFTENSSGFSIAGGSSSTKTLTITGDTSINQDLLTTSSPTFAGLALSTEVAPPSPSAGNIYSDGTNVYYYNGSSWDDLTSTGTTTFLGLTDAPSSYTAGSVLFTSSTAVTEDNANLFWDDTNNRLGLGTVSPTAALDIPAATTGRASARIRSGSAPASPNTGDIYSNGTNLFYWNGSSWDDLTAGAGGGLSGSGFANYVAYWSDPSTLTSEAQLDPTRGGTGIGSYTIGDLLYADSSTSLAKLADTATGNVLLSGGVGVAPSWGQVDLAADVTGTLPVANGGTGATTFTANGILYGNTTSALQVTAAGTSGQLLVANGSGVPTFVSMSGDATLASSGALTIASDSIALTTDTTGNYVATITGGDGISGSSSTEGGTPTLAVDLLTSADGTGSTSSNSGLEFQGTGSDKLTLIQGCGDEEVLAWNESTGVWECTAVSGGIGGVGDITAIGDVTSGAAFNGTQGTTLTFNDADGDGVFTIADLSGAQTWTLPDTTGTIATINGGQTFTSATWNGTAIGSQYGGTGIDTSGSTGVPYVSSGTWAVESQLSVARGGTGATTLTDGGILFGSGTGAITASSVLTNGQLLIGDGTTDPSIATLTAGEGIDITNGSGSITIDGEDATTSNKGIASFNDSYFAVSSGDVTIDDIYLANSGDTGTGQYIFTYGASADSGTTNNTIELAASTPVDTTGTNTHQFLNIDAAIGDASGGTNTVNLIGIDALTGDAQVALNAINIGVLTGTGAAEYAINIASGWDSVLRVDGTEVIDGSGNLTASQLSGTLLSTAADSGSDTLIQGDTLTFTGGTGITTSLIGDAVTITNDLGDSIDLTSEVTGTLPVANGGTGATTFTANGILYGNTTSALQVTAAGTDTQILSNSSGTPGWIDQSSVSAGTLDGVDSLSFLRSDTSDSFTSGILSFSDATLLDLSAIVHDDSTAQGFKLPQNTTLTAISGGGEGYLAYDSDNDQVKVFDGTSWNSISGASTTLQQAYGYDADGSDAAISLTSADDSLVFTNPTSSGSDSAFLLHLNQQNTTAAISALDITQSSNAANAVNVTANSIDTETGLAVTANGLTSGYGLTLASSSTAFTGSLADITLSGSNAANTGSLLTLNNTGTLNTNTSLYIKHYATGTNNLAFRVDDVSGDTTPFVIDGGGQVGIGTASPASLLELYDATANPILTLTGAHNTDYDPQIQFRTDGTPTVKFSAGVDASDDSFKIYSGSGIGGTTEFSIDTDGTVSIADLSSGPMSFPEDSGAISWIDMSVSSTPSAGTIESYTAQIDSNPFLTLYSEADGSGGLQNTGVSIANTTLQTGAKFAVTQATTETTADTIYGIYNSVSDTGIVTTGTDTTYGGYITATRTGATGGTINNYGQYITLTGDTGGTSTNTGLYVSVTGADTNYAGIFTGGNVGIGDASPSALLTVGSGDLVTINSAGQVDAGTNGDGLVTTVNAGACDDTVFTTDTNGLLCVDSSNGRIYYRYGGAWHYSAQTAGFQIPDHETYVYDFAQEKFDKNQQLGEGDFLIPFVEEYMDDGAAHGLYTKFSDVKDQLFPELSELSTVQDVGDGLLSLAKIVQDHADSMEIFAQQLADDQTHIIDLQERLNGTKEDVSVIDTRLTAVEGDVQTMRDENQAIIDFFLAINPDTLVYKDVEGNLNLGEGSLEAAGIVAGAFTVRVADEAAPTIGQGTVLAVETDEDGIDDETESDGKSVTIETSAVTEESRVFVTARGESSQPLSVSNIEAGTGFTVHIPEVTEEDIVFDWVIIESRQDGEE